MNIQQLKVKVKVAAICVATTATLVAGNLAMSRQAGADPASVTAYNGVGSDTIQDVFNAYSGAEPAPPSSTTQFYPPLRSSAASGSKTVNSWDAIPVGGSATAPGCIITKYGGNSFDRPNGSSNGIAALRASVTNLGFQNSAGSCTGAPANTKGNVDFARSSRGPASGSSPCTGTTANCLTFVPFARDAVDFAYFDHATGRASALTTGQLNALYSSATGTIVVNGDTVNACLTQSGSGTTKFWEGAIGVTDAQAVAAATASGCYASSGQPVGIEENGGDAFFTYANALPAGTDAVIDFSAASWISQANLVAVDRSSAGRAGGVDLGAIDALGKAYTGTAPTEAPNPGFYASITYGRDVYVVVSSSKFAFPGDSGLKSLFQGAGSAICSTANQATAVKFGFAASVGACGSSITANLLGS